MDQFKPLYVFATVLKYGSMNAAAPHLQMTASAVSQHIRNLERHYGVQLLVRNTRSLALTESGKAIWQYADQLCQLQQQIDQTFEQLQDEPSGTVSISLPTGYAQLAPFQMAMKKLWQYYPKLRLVIKEENRFTDFSQDDTDIAIRAVPSPDDPNLIVRPLAVWQTWLCASPDYLQHRPIKQQGDLLHAHWLNHSDKILQQSLRELNLPEQLPISRIDCPNSSATAKSMALAGMGVAILLEGDVQPDIQAGKLNIVLPDFPLQTRTIYAVTPHRSQSAKVQVVLEHLKASFADKMESK